MTSTQTAPPLDQPYYGAPFGAAIQRFFKKYATFRGRASRSEFWWWILLAVAVSLVLNVLAAVTGSLELGPDGRWEVTGGAGVIFVVVAVLWTLGTIVPHLAVLVRRLHDTNRSGFWVFIYFVPLAGPIILLVFLLLGSKPEGARFDR